MVAVTFASLRLRPPRPPGPGSAPHGSRLHVPSALLLAHISRQILPRSSGMTRRTGVLSESTVCVFSIFVYVHIYICVYVHMCVCMYVHMRVCTYVHMRVCTYVHMCVCVCVHMCVCVYVHMCVYVYVHMRVCTYVHMRVCT